MSDERNPLVHRGAGVFWFRPLCALAVVILPLLLGGGSDPLVKIILVFTVGLFSLGVPLGTRLTALWRFLFVALAILPLLALLPLGEFSPQTRWRDSMSNLAIYVPSPFIAAQVQVVLNTLPLYYAGLAFAIWGIQAGWTPREKRFLAISFGWVAGLVLTFAALRFGGLVFPPFWEPFTGLGPFASRNQTGLFFAFGVVWCVGLADDFFSEKRRWIAGCWLFLAGAFFAAALLNGSRAGIGFCVFGVFLYLGLVGLIHRQVRYLVLAGTLLLIAVGSLDFFRSHDARFWRIDELLSSDSADRSFRIRIQNDTWDLIMEHPVTGVGLGDYEAVFPFYRERSALDYRVRHAESDWLHFAAESGLPALIFLTVAALLLVTHGWRRLSQGVFSPNALACFVVVFLALAHGFFDQSLHSPGIVFPVLLMASMLISARPGPEGLRHSPASMILGMALILMAAFSLCWLKPARLVRFELQGWRLDPSTNIPLEDVDKALIYAPLAWNMRELRGHLLLRVGRFDPALAEFRASRVLEPFASALVLRESNAWLDASQPESALEAAWEIVVRATPDAKGIFYGEYLSRFAQFPNAKESWLSFGANEIEFLAVSLSYLPPPAAEESLRQILSPRNHPIHLSDFAEQKLIVFSLQREGLGGLVVLREAGLQCPPKVWIAAARELALAGHTSAACALVVQELSPFKGRVPMEELARDYLEAPSDRARALRLVHAYLQEGSLSSAQRVLDRLPSRSEDAGEENFYRGWLANLQGDSVGAWTFFQSYIVGLEAKKAIIR